MRVGLLCRESSSHTICPLENKNFTYHLNYKELFLGNRIRFPKRTTPLWHCQSENVYLSLFQHGLRPRQTTFQQLFVRCDLLAWNYSDEQDTTTPSRIFGYLVLGNIWHIEQGKFNGWLKECLQPMGSRQIWFLPISKVMFGFLDPSLIGTSKKTTTSTRNNSKRRAGNEGMYSLKRECELLTKISLYTLLYPFLIFSHGPLLSKWDYVSSLMYIFGFSKLFKLLDRFVW